MPSAGNETKPDRSAELFSGSSESAALMRAIDWSKTPLGPVDTWAQSLRTIVPIMLASRFAMRVLWGPEFIFLYNDSYRPILGASKHPTAMASRTAESFREVWPIVGPLFHRVYTGEAVALDDTLLPLERNGYLEECYFTLSYSPVPDDEGGIGGVLGVVHETTDRVLAARRLATLRELSANASATGSLENVFERVVAVLVRNPADVPFALFYSIESDAASARLTAHTGLDDRADVRPEVIALNDADACWPLAQAVQHRTLTVSDLKARFGDLRAGPHSEILSSAIVMPLSRVDAAQPYGFFIAGVNPRRALDDAYTGFFELASEQIARVVFEALDRVERERLVARERATDARLRLLFEEAPAAIAILHGPNHIYEFANPRYCELTGRYNLVGQPGRDARPELSGQGIWDIIDRVYATGEPFIGKEYRAVLPRNADHSLDEGYFNFTFQPTRDEGGKIEGVIIFVIEITEQVLARQSEAAARASAEAGRAERARLLVSEQAARSEAERSNNAKDEFLAVVSHELRNPLSAMLGWTRLLRTGNLPPEKRERALETIERNAVNQSQLIEDLLDISRIISGKLRLEVKLVNFADIAQAAIDSARPAIDAKQLRLKVVLDSDTPSLMGDATRLQQIVWNLLTNATKFTPKGGSIQIVLKRVDSTIELSVIDSGRGITGEFLPHVFDRFRQADATTTRMHGGLGLGLSIAKNLTEMHGGTIRAHSDGEGKGSAFIVRLPVAPVREVQAHDDAVTRDRISPPPSWGSAPELAGLKILVVDDEPDAREMVAEVLLQCGCVVQIAGSAKEALLEMDVRRPDVLLSDIGMPEQDGFALIRAVRARAPENGGFTPAACLTAYAGAEDRKRALHAGFNMHVAKPVEPAELVEVVANLGRMSRAMR